MRSRTVVATGAVLGVLVLASGCLSAGAGDPLPTPEEPRAIEVMYPVSADLGETFQEEVRGWAREADVEVEFSPTGNLEALIATRVQGKDPPDVALLTDGVDVRDLAERDELLELSDVVDPAHRSVLPPSLLAAGQLEDGLYAVPVGVQVSSLVWYAKDAAWEDAEPPGGLVQIPTTLADLSSLTERIAATGTAPWCLGIESEDVPGWPATDWVENLVLINHGSAVYQQWVQHEIPFDDPRVLEALEQMEALLLEEGHSSGGREAAVETDVIVAAAAMFADPPGCRLYRHGSSLIVDGGFPDDVVERIDDRIGVFPMPGPTPEQKPVVGGAHLAAVMDEDDAAARDLVRFLASPEFGTGGHARSGTWISPRTDFDVSLYPNDTWRTVAAIVHGATEFVFDGSQQMPRDVGVGSFPRQLIAWISEEQDAATTLANIEASWPS